MGVTEQQRHALLTWFEEQMGPDRAATMMELMPPARADELATKRDLAALERRIDARFDAQDARFDAQDAWFDAKLEAVRSATLRTVDTWLFASQAAVITAIGVAAGVIVALS
jgi:fatty acid desaturase